MAKRAATDALFVCRIEYVSQQKVVGSLPSTKRISILR